jgi:hypothetical protein
MTVRLLSLRGGLHSLRGGCLTIKMESGGQDKVGFLELNFRGSPEGT